VLSSELAFYNDCSEIWISCFDSVIFPLIEELVKINGVEESRRRAFALLCRLFLHNSATIMHSAELLNFWPRYLTCIKKHVQVSDQDLREAARESLKNLFLVLHTHELINDSTGPGEVIWTQTWKELDTMFPNFKQEIFPS
jgi:hypothetical protein